MQILEASFFSYHSIVPEIKNKNGYLTKKEQVEDLQKRNGVNIKKTEKIADSFKLAHQFTVPGTSKSTQPIPVFLFIFSKLRCAKCARAEWRENEEKEHGGGPRDSWEEFCDRAEVYSVYNITVPGTLQSHSNL